MKMQGGMVVPPYSEEYKFCGFCGRKLIWVEKQLLQGFNPVTGEPYLKQKWFACPNYGSTDGSWHYAWWQDIMELR